ncbi:hypothetical protein BDZ94DRAFT_1276582 [Collybia nuda]|uniref:Uncharacterized protein n=1 Tax=Collybia nuda TaxID=64659 RepID=A0A9P6C8K4_9AGAR|nr:hypothetical protein BDZ94DRAFT_1276582 [Collybia nuda]
MAGQPKWSAPKPPPTSIEKTEVSSRGILESELKPTVWTGSKEELLSALPELMKAVHGVSWVMTETPVLILEERNMGLKISDVQLGQKPLIEIIMVRDFACLASDLAMPPTSAPNIKSATNSFTTPSISRTDPLNSKKSSHPSPPLPPSPRKTNEGVYIVGTTKANRHVGAGFNFDSLYTMPSELDNKDCTATGDNAAARQILTDAHHETYHPERSIAFNPPPHPGHHTNAPNRSAQVISGSSPLKRGPDAPTLIQEFPSKRVKLEQMTTSRSDPQVHGSSGQPLLQVSPAFENWNTHQSIPKGPPAMQRQSAPGTSSVNASFSLVHPAKFQRSHDHDMHGDMMIWQPPPANMPYPPISNSPSAISTSIYDMHKDAIVARSFSTSATRPLAVNSPPAISASTPDLPKNTTISRPPLISIPCPSVVSSLTTNSTSDCNMDEDMLTRRPLPITTSDRPPPASKLLPVSSASDHGVRRNVKIPRPPVVPNTSISGLLPTSLVSSSQGFKRLPAGLKFSKIKLEVQEATVSSSIEPPMSNLADSLPDLPFGKPTHQHNAIVKDESQEAALSESLLLKPGRYFPSILPPEVQALLDAYVSVRPVVVIASRAILLDNWGISLPTEMTFSYLGFFRVRRVWENQVTGSLNRESSGRDRATGRVEWCLQCEWAASAQESDPSNLFYRPEAWWAPQRGKGKERAKSDGDDGETDTESSETYRIQRAAHPNYKYRRTAVQHGFESPLPIHVRAPDRPGLPDELFPLGWHCTSCGKLNFRATLRHRTCSSSFCKERPMPESYALPLWFLRDPQQRLPVPMPYNTYPNGVDVRYTVRDNDMRAYTYVVSGDKDESVSVKHIFTCNSQHLQEDATQLLEAFQLDVPMQRKMGKTSLPYFYFEFSSGEASGILPSPPTTTWEDAPPCVLKAKEHLMSRAHVYGEKPEVTVNTLSILAWISTGTRKGGSSLDCKTNSIIIMCLGADTVISVVPKSGFHAPVGSSAGGSGTSVLIDDEAIVADPNLITMDNLVLGDAMDVDPILASGAPVSTQATAPAASSAGGGDFDEVFFAPNDGMDVDPEDVPVLDPATFLGNEDDMVPGDDMDDEPDAASRAPGSSRAAVKPSKPALVITLVHGDLLILSGDDFEYSIKRSGTSILLIGS